MTGVKGKSGGFREGAGRPKDEPVYVLGIGEFEDPDDFLRAVMNQESVELKYRIQAAMKLKGAQRGQPGKKARKVEGAKTTSARSSRYAVAPAPGVVEPE